MADSQRPPASARRPVRILQVGLGVWGQSWAEVVRGVPEVEPAGWVDADPAALAGAAPGTATHASLQDALAEVAEAERPEAVLVTTGVRAHAPVAEAALEEGLHVLVEKPFAPTFEAARALVEAAQRHDRILMVSQNYRFHAAPQKVADLLRSDAIGRVGHVAIDFRKRFPPPPDHPYRRWSQPLLLDMFVHHADLLRYVLGREAVAVSCTSWNAPWSTFEDPASAAMAIEFGDGTVASWRGSWDSVATPTLWSGAWRIDGDHGTIAWASRGNENDSRHDRVEVQRDGATERARLRTPDRMDRHASLTAFAQAVRSGTPPPTSGRDNLNTLAICLAAIRSAAEGRRVPIREILAGE